MATDFRYGETFLVGAEPQPEVFQELTAAEQYAAITIAAWGAAWGYFVMDDPKMIVLPVTAVVTLMVGNAMTGYDDK